MLDSFPLLRTRNVDEFAEWMGRNFAVRNVDLPTGPERFDCTLNHCTLPSLSLTYMRAGTSFRARMDHSDYFVQEFPLSGRGTVQWDGRVVAVSPESGGIVGSPAGEAHCDYSDDYSSLILKITPAALVHRLSLLLDRPVHPPLRITGQPTTEQAAAFGRLVRFAASEFRMDAEGSSAAVGGLEDLILLNFLFSNVHNYSALLEGPPPAAVPWQVRRAVDYIEQHWDEPITIEQLTRITETSARTLFLLFKKTHDVSPMVYLSQVRLRHARDMLNHASPGTSVTKVGFMCGFSNMGNFAMKYYGAFGEKPSDTLRNHRS